jgi:hypothetical protein
MQGPRAGEPAGELWDLLVADALEVIRVDHRAAELAERGRRYSPADAPRAAELGLPHYRKGEATG